MLKKTFACAHWQATMILGSTAPVLATDDGWSHREQTHLWMEEQTLVSGHSRNCM